MTTKELHRNKPDPDEPWRYVCPDCDGQVKGVDEHHKYQCGRCGKWWSDHQLRDQKHE